MNLAATAPTWLLLLFAFLLVAAAAEDAWRLRISNLTSLLILVAAIMAAMLVGPRLALWQNAATFAVCPVNFLASVNKTAGRKIRSRNDFD